MLSTGEEAGGEGIRDDEVATAYPAELKRVVAVEALGASANFVLDLGVFFAKTLRLISLARDESKTSSVFLFSKCS